MSKVISHMTMSLDGEITDLLVVGRSRCWSAPDSLA